MLSAKKSESSTSTSFLKWSQDSQPCRQFQFHEILSATENFDESLVIGSGGFGKVYKGTIFNGFTPVVAAIKRLDSNSNQGAPEFWSEVETLSKLRHCQLVCLFGYCNHGEEMILIYEYMPNGTLEDHLHKLGTPLSWVQRLKICIGAARGLHYLHTGTGIEYGIIHRDVKTSNILLHESWAAKISDFGLSKIGPTNQPSTYVNTHVKGTFGYLDPNYFTTGRLTRKSDVYAFGVVLFEVLCRKRAVDKSLDEDQWGLVTWAQDSIKQGNLKRIIDSDISGQISPKCLKEFVQIAERCLLNNPKQRPTMAEVVVGLESILNLQEKMNISLQAGRRTIFGKMISFLPNRDNAAHGDSELSSNIKGSKRNTSSTIGADNNMNLETKQVPEDSLISSPSLRVFKFADLEKATRNFNRDMLLGEGGTGKVFLGWVDQKTFAPSTHGVGIAVAVKRLNRDSINDEWEAEVGFSGRLAHPNIVSLLGWCVDERCGRLLVYEYMQNRSLKGFLFPDAPDIATPLSWETRLTIMIGAARGLVYLHSLKDQVIFRGVKSSMILLDQDFNSKLRDFRLAKSCSRESQNTHVSTRVMGTYVYLDPEYMETGHLRVKSAIYGFGVVLLETLTGRRAMDCKGPSEQHNLVKWASPLLANRRKLKKIMDQRLESNYPKEGAFKCAALILRCVASRSKCRPSSEEVLQSLEEIYAVKN